MARVSLAVPVVVVLETLGRAAQELQVKAIRVLQELRQLLIMGPVAAVLVKPDKHRLRLKRVTVGTA